ncbi:putative spermidine synthase [Aspergillus venezuelensis]
MGDIVHPTIKGGWFTEASDLWPGQAMTLEVDEILHHEKSEQHDILLFKTTNYGVVLAIDGIIHCTEYDEFFYHEMITHIALNSHPSPRNVLVIGGGDGGVAREVVKHPLVAEVNICEDNEAIMNVSKKYLPEMGLALDNAAVKVHICDELEYLAGKCNYFDIIIADNFNPVGNCEKVVQKSYFEILNRALREGGIVAVQAESQWLHLPTIRALKSICKEIFPIVEYAFTPISTYPSGQTGFIFCSKSPDHDIKQPMRGWTREEEDQLCRYYNQEVHRASFILPSFARKSLV